MITRIRHSKLGFTLVELAIVLAIAGLLFAGLWRLMSGGNQQLRDQAAATTQSQLISAAKGYLASSQGQSFMQANNASTTAFALALPTSNTNNANCRASIAAAQNNFCDFLPTGFSTATTNSYNDTFAIEVVGDGKGITSAPQTYSFMVMATGGDVIPDTSGGRISSLIGGDGGFIYSSNVCGAPTNQMACGAYGAWAVQSTAYGFAGAYAGSVASRSYYSPEQSSTYPWLARSYINASTSYNTMTADLFMDANGNGAHAGRSYIYMSPNAATTTNGGQLNMATGELNMVTHDANSGAGIINLAGGKLVSVSTSPGISLTTGGTRLDNATPLLTVGTACSLDSSVSVPGITSPDASCTAGMQILGDGYFAGRVNVNSLYATTFIYQGSDIRLKTDVHQLSNPLDDVMRLKPVSYALKSTGQKSFGVIAQDIEKVYPQLVSERADGIKTVNYQGLIAPLIGAVQELKAENDNQRQQLKDQAARQEKLESELKKAP
ncbi:MAG TPA: tail fiber domain-containing protein [Alphaproteobacteria bacterium]|nr:tail fiber domain-containing protein [Alphaproteobacteria bacterium]